MTDSSTHSSPRWGAGGNPEQGEWANFDLANIAQGLKGCDAVSPYDPERAYRALRKWAGLLVADRKQLIEQLQALQTAAQRILEAPKGTSHSQFRFWLMDALGDAYPASTSGAREEGDDA